MPALSAFYCLPALLYGPDRTLFISYLGVSAHGSSDFSVLITEVGCQGLEGPAGPVTPLQQEALFFRSEVTVLPRNSGAVESDCGPPES